MKAKLENISSLLTDPNFLTISRVAVVPVFIALMMDDSRVCTFFAALIFCIAAATDFFDVLANAHFFVGGMGETGL